MPWNSGYTGGAPAAPAGGGGGWNKSFNVPPPAPLPKSGGGHGLLHTLGAVAGDLNPARLVEGASGLGQAGYDAAKVIYKGDKGVLTGNQKEQQQASDTVGAYAKGVAKDYASRYGPLAHGHVGRFAGQALHDPLSYLLDAATVATLGGAGAAKGGELLAKAGAISRESRLANLGRPVDLTVPDWNGERVVVKQSSPNPVIRARQVATNRAMQNLPESIPFGRGAVTPGSTDARLVKALSKPGERAGARLRLDMQPFQQSFARLSKPERAAWHMTARGLDPQAYRAFIAEHPQVSPGMLKILDNPKVSELVANPTPRLQDALAKGESLSHQLTAENVRQGVVDPVAAAERPYLHMRLVNGAKFEPTFEPLPPEKVTVGRSVTPADRKNIGTVTAVDSANGTAIVHFYNRATGLQETKDFPITDLLHQTGTEMVGGPDIKTLATEHAAAGKPQPFYVPDSAVTKGTRGASRFRSRPTGLGEPGLPGSAKQNLGVLASKGMLNIHEDALTREFGLLANRTEGSVLHDELVKHAGELPAGEALPHGWDFLKLNYGEATAPYTQRVGGEFEHGLNPGTADRVLTQDARDPNIATKNGNMLIVPSTVRQILQDQSLSYNGALQKLLYNHPTSVWKHLVLGLRPAFFANITVGNSILGALQMAPGLHGFHGWLNQVVPGSEKILGPKLTKETMAAVLPEQLGGGTFGGSMGFGPNKGLRLASKAYQGVMPATIAYENVLRRAMAEGWAKWTPEVQALMRANGGDVNKALRDVAQTHPQIVNDISKRIDDALGNYRRYNKLEKAIRQLIPFYGWDRHIVRSVARLALERPAVLNALLQVGQVGNQRRGQQLGPVPSYGEPWVRLPGLPAFMGPLNGRTPVLNTKSLNPFNTAVELAKIPQAVTGVAGGAGSEELSSGLNPIVQALIEQMTGRSLLSGAPIKGNAWVNTAENLPQAGIVQALRGRGKPTKPTSLYQGDLPTLLATFLGVPVKKLNPQTAHLYAAQQGKRRP